MLYYNKIAEKEGIDKKKWARLPWKDKFKITRMFKLLFKLIFCI